MIVTPCKWEKITWKPRKSEENLGSGSVEDDQKCIEFENTQKEIRASGQFCTDPLLA